MRKDIKKKSIKRLNIIEGQIRGIKKMIEEEKYCIDIILQLLATEKAIRKTKELILENHLTTHLMSQTNKDKKKKLLKELLEIFKLSQK